MGPRRHGQEGGILHVCAARRHAPTCTHSSTHMHARARTCTHVHAHAPTCENVQAGTHLSTHACTDAHARTCTHARPCTCPSQVIAPAITHNLYVCARCTQAHSLCGCLPLRSAKDGFRSDFSPLRSSEHMAASLSWTCDLWEAKRSACRAELPPVGTAVL